MTSHIHVLTPSRHMKLLEPWLGYRKRFRDPEGPEFFMVGIAVDIHIWVGPSPTGAWTEPEWLELHDLLDGDHHDDDDGLVDPHVAFLVWCSARSPCVDLGTYRVLPTEHEDPEPEVK